MKPRVYIETTIPSFYHETRRDPKMVSRREWTQEWWKKYASKYELVTSDAVLEELQSGNYPSKRSALSLIRKIDLVHINETVLDIVDAYIAHHVMPKDPRGDALHLALASYYKCDYLLTWNCKHIANTNKQNHIRVINTILNLHIPSLITPLELLGG